ncbi:MAG: hypothetical protein M1355_04300 [Patescibacteria group bacterium]|nr:hypothetical protein [Patescibacteria group bacterium]
MENLDIISSQTLVKLGLSPHEAKVYQVLLEEGSSSVKNMAERLSILPNALYRLLENLIEKEFISVAGKHPAIYQAISPSIALESLAKKKTAEIELLKDKAVGELSSGRKNVPATEVNLLSGRNAMMITAAKMVQEAKKEILIISIGEEIPEELLLAHRDAIEKGVTIKMVAHEYHEKNKNLLGSWKKMKWEVRHYPGEGFHLIIIDAKKSLLAVNNPLETRERTGMQIFSEDLSKALREYFFTVWQKAKEIG